MNPEELFAVNPGWNVLMSDLGIDPANVLRRAGLPADLLSRGQAALPPKEYFALIKGVEDEAGDPNLPILIGRAISVEAFDPPLFAAICSRNLNQAAVRIAQHKRLIGPMRLLVVQFENETTIESRWPPDLQPPASLAIGEIVFWVALVRLATRLEIQPVRALAPEPPTDIEAYREYLGIAIEEGPRQSVTFSAEDASRPFLTANEPMWEFFQSGLRRRLTDIDETATTSDRVRGALLELLPAGQASIEDVSGALGVPTRTLQRRLSMEDSSFRLVLQETRKDLALYYLENSQLHVGEVSFLLGFESTNSFSRAFNSWTGETPLQARATLRAVHGI